MDFKCTPGLVLGTLAAAATALANGNTLPAPPEARSSVTAFGHRTAGQVIFDQGPSTGINSGCWQNITRQQNFSDPGPLPAGTSVSGIVIFTCVSPKNRKVTFKAVDENSHVFLHTESGAPASWVGDGNGGFIVTYMLKTPFVVPADVNVGYGLSGNGFDMGQYSVETPADGLMSTYSGTEFRFLTSDGDQMYQLLGGPTCDVNGDC